MIKIHLAVAVILAVVSVALTILVFFNENDLIFAFIIPVAVALLEFFYLIRLNNLEKPSRFFLINLFALYGSVAWVGFLLVVWVLFVLGGGVNIY